MGQPWTSFRIAGLALDVPDQLAPSPERGIEGGTAVLEGAGMRLTVDASAFADPLTGYANKPGYEHWRESLGGDTADFVLFEEDGVRTLAVKIPGRATAVVHQPATAQQDTALQILRSIRKDQGEFND
ncbi:hypothetical protein FDW83_14875 [Pseudarthrobacter sp. NamE2]|uniref:hypothetical protein n=1 Tax=Pseudarthrobacter sp. NamE2 TaxID=2576838 RepID=UPI0010FF2383|nr:hypothetical protein [Pseudarthrobacter sp. NamE2]TLM81704.1 hypothetical protein FDW83_14875 [Pseudarthrobacter sp. NamE2]